MENKYISLVFVRKSFFSTLDDTNTVPIVFMKFWALSIYISKFKTHGPKFFKFLFTL